VNTSSLIGAGLGFGILALVIYIAIIIVGFIISAFIAALWIRLIIRFMRKTLDREYRYMRGDYFTDQRPRADQPPVGPRNW
jgi:phosphate/sulfate permease